MKRQQQAHVIADGVGGVQHTWILQGSLSSVRGVQGTFYISQYEDDKDDVVNRLDDDNDESWFSGLISPCLHMYLRSCIMRMRVMGKGIFGYSAKNVNTAMATYVALRAVDIRMLAVSSDLS